MGVWIMVLFATAGWGNTRHATLDSIPYFESYEQCTAALAEVRELDSDIEGVCVRGTNN